MRQIYILFSEVGWAWAVIFGLGLLINRLWSRKPTRGVDVVSSDEKQH